MKQQPAQAPPTPPAGFDPVLDACLADLQAGTTLSGFLQAEQYKQVDAAVRRAVAIADPLGGRPSLDEDFARRSIVAEIALILRVHERSMASLVYEATQLCGPFAHTLAELSAGTITARHAREILAGAVLLPSGLHASFEEEALRAARTLNVSAFRQAVARTRERLHPDPLAERVERSGADRRVVFEPDADGMAWLHLYLAAPDALAITMRVDQLATAAQHEAAEADAVGAAAAESPDNPAKWAGVLGSGTHAQLEADIATELLLGQPGQPGFDSADGATARTHLPGAAFTRPDVFVAVPQLTISVDTLIGTSEEPAELHGYGPIDADTARRLCTEASTLHRLLTDPIDGTPLQVDPTQYRLTASLRRWILYRDQTCTFPGCTRKAQHSEIDHTRAWEQGGLSTADNLSVLCKKHHRLKHHSRWRVKQLGGGKLNWRSPGGREYVTGPSWLQHGPLPPPKPPAAEPAEPTPTYPDDVPF